MPYESHRVEQSHAQERRNGLQHHKAYGICVDLVVQLPPSPQGLFDVTNQRLRAINALLPDIMKRLRRQSCSQLHCYNDLPAIHCSVADIQNTKFDISAHLVTGSRSWLKEKDYGASSQEKMWTQLA